MVALPSAGLPCSILKLLSAVSSSTVPSTAVATSAALPLTTGALTLGSAVGLSVGAASVSVGNPGGRLRGERAVSCEAVRSMDVALSAEDDAFPEFRPKLMLPPALNAERAAEMWSPMDAPTLPSDTVGDDTSGAGRFRGRLSRGDIGIPAMPCIIASIGSRAGSCSSLSPMGEAGYPDRSRSGLPPWLEAGLGVALLSVRAPKGTSSEPRCACSEN
mmetsp:Transcript_73/g.249  ORF Transcript_73/g.249 Transcript_73/m.249 type:complete len:217 (-) Transcript_73:613-1263(-)